MSPRPKSVVLLILDGFGYLKEAECSAIAQANTPCRGKLQNGYPMTLLAILGVPQPKEMTSESFWLASKLKILA